MAKRTTTPAALTQQQLAALSHIAAGKSISEAARLIGVNRGSVQRWFRENVQFRAAYNAWKIELRESTQARLLAICEDAVGAIHRAIQKDDARCAMEMLRRMGMLRSSKPGSPEAAELMVRDSIAKRELNVEFGEKVDDLMSEELFAALRGAGGMPTVGPVGGPVPEVRAGQRALPGPVGRRGRRMLPAPGRGTAR